MRKLIILIVAAIAFATGTTSADMINSSAAVASKAKTTESGFLRYHSFEPCNFWRFINGPGGFGYVCVSPGMTVDVPDAFDVDHVLRNYEDRIETLEQRLETLEKKLEARE